MKVILQWIVSFLFFISSASISAYELTTHGAITYHSYKRSILSDAQFIKDLGISSDEAPFGTVYYDMSHTDAFGIRLRKQYLFEEDIIKENLKQKPLSLEGWLMQGAIREDDLGNKLISGFPFGPDPHDDPDGNIFRVFNHFYDPVYDRGTFPGVKSSDWAFGTLNAFTSPIVEDETRLNRFTLFDAIEAMYRATTGRDKEGNPAGRGVNDGRVNATHKDRLAYWATTFRTLGDMVHLVQDIAQPQHTRNDAHSGFVGFGDVSVYEKYIEARAIGAKKHLIDGSFVTLNALNYNGYPIPIFSNYGDFWSTREGSNGRGMADYSNRGFFTAGTNIGDSNNEYLLPKNDASVYNKSIIKYNNISGEILTTSLLLGTVVDKQSSQYTKQNAPLSTESLFHTSLQAYGKRSYTLNKYNYDAMADLLLPRAVSYSAGLINHFFRGRLQVLQASNLGTELTLLFKNVSAKDQYNNGIIFDNGKFEVFYEDINGIMQPLTVTSSDLPSGDTTVVAGDNMLHDTTYTFKIALPPEANIALAPYTDTAGNKLGTDTPFVLVFRGQIGQDAGIAANAFSRDGLTAFYSEYAGTDKMDNVSFHTEVASNPVKGWRAFSIGPPKEKGLNHGPVTNLGNGMLLVNGTATASVGYFYSKIFKSTDSGRSYEVGISDLAPNYSGRPYDLFESKIFIGGTSLATLRKTGIDSNNVTSYQYYQSDDLGQTWQAGGTFGGIVRDPRELIYLGESGGLKKYAAIAVTRVVDQDGSLRKRWTLLRSNDSGQTFVAVPILPSQFSPSADPNMDITNISANLVYLGTDTAGSEILGLAVKMLSYYVQTPYPRYLMKYYVSNDGGVTWNERGEIPPSPRIVAGKFPERSNFFIQELIYLGTPQGGQPHLYLSYYQLNQVGLKGNIIEYFHSTDGGANWTPVQGPNITVTTAKDSQGNEWEVMNGGIPALVYPLDNGAIPGLYN